MSFRTEPQRTFVTDRSHILSIRFIVEQIFQNDNVWATALTGKSAHNMQFPTNYTLRDDSFIYLSRPAAALRSTLSLQIDSEQKAVSLAPDSRIEVDLHGRVVSIVTKGCGVFISVVP